MELDVFPDELRKQAVEIGQVLKMDMYLGTIDEEDLKEAISHACDSPDVKPYILKKYGLR